MRLLLSFQVPLFYFPFSKNKGTVSKKKKVTVLYKGKMGRVFNLNNIKNFLKIFYLHFIFNLIYVCWFCTRYINVKTFQKLISLWLPCWLLDLSLFTYAQIYFLTCKVMCYSCYSIIHKMVTILNKNLIQSFEFRKYILMYLIYTCKRIQTTWIIIQIRYFNSSSFSFE